MAGVFGRVGGVTALLLGALVAACSSGQGNATSSYTGGGGIDCGSLCQKILAQNCPNDSASDCNSKCSAELGQYQECSAQMGAMLSCTLEKLPLTCSSSGKATYQTPAGVDSSQLFMAACPGEYQAFAGCVACLASANDSPSTACLKSKCCSQMKAAVSDPSMSDFENCTNLCSSTSCTDSCKSQYPSAAAALDSVTSCGLSSGC